MKYQAQYDWCMAKAKEASDEANLIDFTNYTQMATMWKEKN